IMEDSVSRYLWSVTLYRTGMAAETTRFPAGELASLLARFTLCGVSPSSFSRGSLVVSFATQPGADKTALL
ncbi:MAG: hypothetical protein WAM18_07410, partial [Halobacillus sp.]|uniref:hypothetical protein n=1 Tax=Halobacillus sp. TaxID=56800 RepID=UPI003BB1D27F